MPQLPGGRHIAICADSVHELIERAARGLGTHELMAIESVAQLRPYIDVLYFRPGDDTETHSRVADGSNRLPIGWVSFRSGFTLATIEPEQARWAEEDRCAFEEFLQLERTRRFIQELLAYVQAAKVAILERGPFLARVLALWWHAGVHPLQPGGQDET